MKNRETKHRKIELTSDQIGVIRNAVNRLMLADAKEGIEIRTVAHIFGKVVEDVVVTVVD